MSQAASDLVWYAAYGSNLQAARFRCYLAGGRPAGAVRTYRGCRDRSGPLADAPLRLDWPLYFAGSSRVWGGGCAFLDPDRRRPGTALARGWLLRAEQLCDVLAQENHRQRLDVDLHRLRREGRLQLGRGRYEQLLWCGERGGVPVVTATASWERNAAVLSPPTPAYARVVGDGLAEAHGLDSDAAADYLLACPGVAASWDRQTLQALLTPARNAATGAGTRPLRRTGAHGESPATARR